eukprot:1998049-Rhodomonas_salina.2
MSNEIFEVLQQHFAMACPVLSYRSSTTAIVLSNVRYWVLGYWPVLTKVDERTMTQRLIVQVPRPYLDPT